MDQKVPPKVILDRRSRPVANIIIILAYRISYQGGAEVELYGGSLSLSR